MRTILISALFLMGCGVCNSPNSTNVYADKCTAACDAAPSACSSQKQACIDTCEAKTEGLSINCAQCLIDNSKWYCGCGNCVCGPNATTCMGFGMPSVSDAPCDSFCRP